VKGAETTRHSGIRALAALFLLFEGLLLLLYSGPLEPIERFVAVSLLASAVGLLLWLVLGQNPPPFLRRPGWWILGAGLLVRASLIAVPPTASDDVYRYLWDGRVQAHGIDPYRYPPSDTALAGLRTPDLPARVNHPDMRSIDPPGAEWLFFLSSLAGGDGLLAMKCLMLIAEGCTLLFLLLALRSAGMGEYGLALYAFSPLPILHFMVDLHVDGLAIPFLALALWLRERGRTGGAAAALGGSALIKLFPLSLLPAFVASVRAKERWRSVLLVSLIVGAAYAPYLVSGGRPFEALGAFAENWEANSSLFRLLYEAIGNNQIAHRIATGATVLLLLGIALTELPFREKIYWSIIGFFLLAPTVHPWYLTWVACLLPLVPGREGIAFTVLVNLAGFTLVGYRLRGVWEQPVWALLLEYVPLYAMLLFRLSRRDWRA
jgi:hypothetical protein